MRVRVGLGLSALCGLLATADVGAAEPDLSAQASPPASLHAIAHRTITTNVADAQAAYDTGLLFLYAFNIGAARDAFTRARTLDPSCAMAFFGEAITNVTDINRPPDAAALVRGRIAIALAERATEASADERALIAAAAKRFDPSVLQGSAKAAYANAMVVYANQHPLDDDAAVEASIAIWQSEPNVKTETGKRIGPLLDRVLADDPMQFGAHHMRIHFEEESGRPADALSDADFLDRASYDPGESHLPHMAGHIFVRLGDYERVIESNETALANDADYFAHDRGAGAEYMKGYHDHDLSFVLYGLTTLGRNARASSIAQNEDALARAQVALRLHDWNAVIASGTTNQFFLSVARAGLGRADALKSASQMRTRLPRAFASAYVRGVFYRARGDHASAAAAFAAAFARRPAGLGDPKFAWSTPIGEAYGAELLRVARFGDAERIFLDELARYPNDPRLLFGKALAREGLGEDASADRDAASALWRGADPLTVDELG